MTIELTKDSTVKDLVELFNEGKLKYQDIIDLFSVSRDLVQKRLAGIDLHYDNKAKKFIGEAIEEDLNIKLLELFEKQRGKQSKALKTAKATETKADASIETSIETSKETASTIEAPANEIIVKSSQKKVANEAASKASSELDAIDMLLLQNETESNQRVYRGFYWDKDIIDFLDNVKHGNKSDLMNEIVRTVLKAKGLI